MSDKLLLDEYPLIILPELAVKIGLNEAVVLQQIHYWLRMFEKSQDKRHFRNNRWWVYNSVAEWCKQFPFWSYNTVKRALGALREPYEPKENSKSKRVERAALLVTTSKYNRAGFDGTLWYTIDYDALDNMGHTLAQNGLAHGPERASGKGQNGLVEKANLAHAIPETTRDKAETTNKEAAAGPSSEGEKEHFCHEHGVQMKRKEKNGDVWYSHRKTNGKWCHGEGTGTGTSERDDGGHEADLEGYARQFEKEVIR